MPAEVAQRLPHATPRHPRHLERFCARTPRPDHERKSAFHLVLLSVALAGATFAGAGCSTPGQLQIYSLATSGELRNLQAATELQTRDAPLIVAQPETVSGFAYDPFTDHFFLRLDPGNRIRVVDRPARTIKRDFEIQGAPAIGRGDLAIRPRDGHIFVLQSATAAVIETTRLGQAVRTIALSGLEGAPLAVALDTDRNLLLVLNADGRRVTTHDLQGIRVGEITLSEAVGSSLAFDAGKREFYAPLRAPSGVIGVFNAAGKLLRTTAGIGPFVDVGVRSFVRVF